MHPENKARLCHVYVEEVQLQPIFMNKRKLKAIISTLMFLGIP
jgi:hypothetical protein